MIQDSVLFGADRYTEKAGKLCDKIDVFCGKDPKISREKRSKRLAGRAVLQKMGGWDVPLPPTTQYGTALKGLLSHGYIERKKSKKGFKTTKKGKAKIKSMGEKWFTK
jgi:hypothetical protein